MKTVIHVNQHVIKRNAKQGERNPVLTVKTYKSNTYANEVVVYGQDGLPAARIVYRPTEPLSCGARVWIETNNKVEAITQTDQKTETHEGKKEDPMLEQLPDGWD